MILGITATALTFIALMLSVVAYFLFDRKQDEFYLRFARLAFFTAGGLIVFQVVMLMYGILTHHFEWTYVFSYSSRDLSLFTSFPPSGPGRKAPFYCGCFTV